jgi:hypothetical protein
MKLQDFVQKGLTIINDMGEIRETTESSIIFPNGWIANIVKVDEGFSVGVCDYNGYFNWEFLRPFGRDTGVIICKNEEEVCKALTIVEMLRKNS